MPRVSPALLLSRDMDFEGSGALFTLDKLLNTVCSMITTRKFCATELLQRTGKGGGRTKSRLHKFIKQ